MPFYTANQAERIPSVIIGCNRIEKWEVNEDSRTLSLPSHSVISASNMFTQIRQTQFHST